MSGNFEINVGIVDVDKSKKSTKPKTPPKQKTKLSQKEKDKVLITTNPKLKPEIQKRINIQKFQDAIEASKNVTSPIAVETTTPGNIEDTLETCEWPCVNLTAVPVLNAFEGGACNDSNGNSHPYGCWYNTDGNDGLSHDAYFYVWEDETVDPNLWGHCSCNTDVFGDMCSDISGNSIGMLMANPCTENWEYPGDIVNPNWDCYLDGSDLFDLQCDLTYECDEDSGADNAGAQCPDCEYENCCCIFSGCLFYCDDGVNGVDCPEGIDKCPCPAISGIDNPTFGDYEVLYEEHVHHISSLNPKAKGIYNGNYNCDEVNVVDCAEDLDGVHHNPDLCNPYYENIRYYDSDGDGIGCCDDLQYWCPGFEECTEYPTTEDCGEADEYCDCEENYFDCEGSCNGSALEDECGICNGDGPCECQNHLGHQDGEEHCECCCTNQEYLTEHCGCVPNGFEDDDYCYGCTDQGAFNYCETCTVDSGDCEFVGCVDNLDQDAVDFGCVGVANGMISGSGDYCNKNVIYNFWTTNWEEGIPNTQCTETHGLDGCCITPKCYYLDYDCDGIGCNFQDNQILIACEGDENLVIDGGCPDGYEFIDTNDYEDNEALCYCDSEIDVCNICDGDNTVCAECLNQEAINFDPYPTGIYDGESVWVDCGGNIYETFPSSGTDEICCSFRGSCVDECGNSNVGGDYCSCDILECMYDEGNCCLDFWDVCTGCSDPNAGNYDFDWYYHNPSDCDYDTPSVILDDIIKFRAQVYSTQTITDVRLRIVSRVHDQYGHLFEIPRDGWFTVSNPGTVQGIDDLYQIPFDIRITNSGFNINDTSYSIGYNSIYDWQNLSCREWIRYGGSYPYNNSEEPYDTDFLFKIEAYTDNIIDDDHRVFEWEQDSSGGQWYSEFCECDLSITNQEDCEQNGCSWEYVHRLEPGFKVSTSIIPPVVAIVNEDFWVKPLRKFVLDGSNSFQAANSICDGSTESLKYRWYRWNGNEWVFIGNPITDNPINPQRRTPEHILPWSESPYLEWEAPELPQGYDEIVLKFKLEVLGETFGLPEQEMIGSDVVEVIVTNIIPTKYRTSNIISFSDQIGSLHTKVKTFSNKKNVKLKSERITQKEQELNDKIDYVFGYLFSGTVEDVVSCIPGDVNGTGDVNVSDVVSIVNFVLSGVDLSLESAVGNDLTECSDVNGDGQVNVTDIVSIVNMILGN
tara:strand:- start:16868 stop:20452 length:3585 start_codon:yes stop_codon:yes gene_type:complete